MDPIDKHILNLLQTDAGLPVADIAQRVGLTVTPCWQRIKRLYANGVIRRRVALLDPLKVGAGISVFVTVRTNQHDADWLTTFAETVAPMPEVLEFYRMSGEADYLLRVVVPDIESYDAFYKKLTASVALTDVSSSFAMEQIKYTTMMPISLPHANLAASYSQDNKKSSPPPRQRKQK